MNETEALVIKTNLPDTPFFRAHCDAVDLRAKNDLELLCAGSAGYLFVGGYYPVNQYYNYGMLLGDAVSFSVAYLARKTRATIGEVLRHLATICDLGLIREGCVDLNERVVYLTRTAKRLQFVEYALDDRGREIILERPPEIWETLYDDIVEEPVPVPEETQQSATLKEQSGEESFAQLVRRYNDALPDTEITKALDETERLLRLLSDTLKNMPPQNKKLNEVASKYLPQLEKLLQAYQTFDVGDSDAPGFNGIRTAIIEAIHMFNKALRQLTNDLISDAELEITAEISRMKMMLERDGLLKSAFSL